MSEQKRGRPTKDLDNLRNESLIVRLESTEKQAFKDAAGLAGISLSTWVRERLRQVAIRKLENAVHPIAFLKRVTLV